MIDLGWMFPIHNRSSVRKGVWSSRHKWNRLRTWTLGPPTDVPHQISIDYIWHLEIDSCPNRQQNLVSRCGLTEEYNRQGRGRARRCGNSCEHANLSDVQSSSTSHTSQARGELGSCLRWPRVEERSPRGQDRAQALQWTRKLAAWPWELDFHSFYQYLLTTHYVSCSVLSTGDTAMNNTDKIPLWSCTQRYIINTIHK